eukprot:IDg7795t1
MVVPETMQARVQDLLLIPNTARLHNCGKCDRKSSKLRCYANLFRLFLPKETLKDVSMDLMSPLQKSSRGLRHLMVIIDCYTKLTKTDLILSFHLKAWDIFQLFVSNWMFCYGAPVALLPENVLPFDCKFF